MSADMKRTREPFMETCLINGRDFDETKCDTKGAHAVLKTLKFLTLHRVVGNLDRKTAVWRSR